MFLFEQLPGKLIIPQEYSFLNLVKWVKNQSRFNKFKRDHMPYRISCEIVDHGHVKQVVDVKMDGTEITKKLPQQWIDVKYTFGSNGPGLSDEMLAIGADIRHWSKYYCIGLCNEGLFIDECDDVYDLVVHFTERCYELTEGASGYYPKDSDEYWDEAAEVFKSKILPKLIKGLKNGTEKIANKEAHYTIAYTYMGLTNAVLSAENLISLYPSDDLTKSLIKSFENAYNVLSNDKDNLMGWDDFSKYKKALKDVRTLFYKLLVSKHRLSKKEISDVLNDKKIK